MSTETRYDASGLGKARRDARGFLVVPARPARTGILTYRRADGTTVRELRRDVDVFAPESLETYQGASVVIGHQGDVTPANVKALEVGVVTSAARQDGSFVAAELSIRDAAAIARVESGELVELSAGYAVEIDPTPGEHEGQRYDQVQKSIRVNHVALLASGQGRSGSDVRLRMDAHSAELVDDDASSERKDDAGQSRKETVRMKVIRIDSKDVEFSDDGAAVVSKLQSDVEKATARADAAAVKLTEAEAATAKAKADLTAATDPKVRADSVKARVGLEKAASKVLGDEDVSALSDRDVQVKAITKIVPAFKAEGRSDDYVSASFDAHVLTAKAVDQGLAVTQAVIGASTVDSARTDATDQDKQLAAIEAKRLNAWKSAREVK